MPRRRRHVALHVYLNNRRVGDLLKHASGAIEFRYHPDWLDWEHAIPVSLSLPLRHDPWRGEPVVAVFENLLPDGDALRRRIAERVGADGTDAHGLLAAIGTDCVGALQFLRDDSPPPPTQPPGALRGEPVDDSAIETLLNNLHHTPLGLRHEDDFRISVAGVQEKTALLWHDARWWKPSGTTPTTYLIKPQIGRLPNGIGLSHSVENEYYCLRLLGEFGLPVNRAQMHTFGSTRALVIERFDRRWSPDGRLLRLPQEDCCQALSIPPSRKYETDGGPGMVEILKLLVASDTPVPDQHTFLRAQILFWLIGASDGHGKNFSVFLRPGGRFALTPLCDVLTAQPSVDARQVERKQLRLAMSVGNRRHYRMHEIQGRHFVETAAAAGVSSERVRELFEELARTAPQALARVQADLPAGFPPGIHAAVERAVRRQLRRLTA